MCGGDEGVSRIDGDSIGSVVLDLEINIFIN